MTTDLKPCPFCGSEMEIPDRGPLDSWKIRHPRKDDCPLDQMIIYEHDEEGFARRVDGWNRRVAPPDAVPAEKVRGLVERWSDDVPELEIISGEAACTLTECVNDLIALLERGEEANHD